MATTLRERLPIHGVEAIAERPDGTTVPFTSYATPLYDASGTLVGASRGAMPGDGPSRVELAKHPRV
jgi:hypothetical protein